MKSIKISETNWKKLNRFKYNLGYSTIDEVLSSIFDIVQKFKLGGEMEVSKK